MNIIQRFDLSDCQLRFTIWTEKTTTPKNQKVAIFAMAKN